MAVNDDDTIAAIATPPGRGAVGIVRVSGPMTVSVARALLNRQPPPRQATLACFLDAAGEAIDQGIVLYFPAPHSFTGEDVLELQGHGGSALLDLLLHRLIDLGCRLARPGEFSERAFLNDKLDLAQAEGVADLIDATSQSAARAAMRTLRGEFSARVHGLTEALKRLRIYVEAAIDFPDEEVDFLSDAQLRDNLLRVFAEFDALTRAARQGVVLNDGLKIVLIGAPNVGKSSLMNALAGEEVAIVTAVPGTTRDLLRQPVRIGGVAMNLIDTAGLRPSADPIEMEGMRRARAELALADHVLIVTDQDDPAAAAPLPAEMPPDMPVTLVVNKIDLSGQPPRLDQAVSPPRIHLSALSGQGIELLRQHLQRSAGLTDADSGAFTARRRHLAALQRARGHVDAAARVLTQDNAFELFAEELRMAQNALGEITGTYGSEDLLGDIFSSFCIGK
jgi:tRNA modification GTPase